MNVALIAHGLLPIPPTDWGAVETTLWHHKRHLERLGHSAYIFNSHLINHVVHSINTSRDFDLVHCHNELFAGYLRDHLQQPYVVTCHHGGLYRYEPGSEHFPELAYPLADCMQAPGYFALDAKAYRLFQRLGYAGFLSQMPNGVECDMFRVAPRGNGRALCLGYLEPRKRQHWLARAAAGRIAIDVVGPWDRRQPDLLEENETVRYLGVWDRQTVYDRMTDYGCLVLLSESEGCTPKVVLEALAAGVSVVITEACAGNLPPKPFIHVLPDDRLAPDAVVSALQTAIRENEGWREAIRAHALEHLDCSIVAARYVRAVEEFQRFLAGPHPGRDAAAGHQDGTRQDSSNSRPQSGSPARIQEAQENRSAVVEANADWPSVK